jgi:hypothetical protein
MSLSRYGVIVHTLYFVVEFSIKPTSLYSSSERVGGIRLGSSSAAMIQVEHCESKRERQTETDREREREREREIV